MHCVVIQDLFSRRVAEGATSSPACKLSAFISYTFAGDNCYIEHIDIHTKLHGKHTLKIGDLLWPCKYTTGNFFTWMSMCAYYIYIYIYIYIYMMA